MKYYPEDGRPIEESMSLCVYDPATKSFQAPPWYWRDELSWDAETVRRKTQAALELFRQEREGCYSLATDPFAGDEPEEPAEQPFVLGAERKTSRPIRSRKSNPAQKSLFDEQSDDEG